MKTKHRIAILFAAAVALLATGCQTPKVSLKNALLKNLTTSRIDVGLNLDILNPNSYSLPLQHVAWDLKLFNSPFTDGTTEFTRSIGANSRAEVEVPLGIRYNAIQMGVKGMLTKRSIPWGFGGACSFRTPAGPVQIDFARDGAWRNPLL